MIKRSNSYFDDKNYKHGDFVISTITKKELEKYNINLSVREFKALVLKSDKFKTIYTGASSHLFKKTKVYNYNDFRGINYNA